MRVYPLLIGGCYCRGNQPKMDLFPCTKSRVAGMLFSTTIAATDMKTVNHWDLFIDIPSKVK